MGQFEDMTIKCKKEDLNFGRECSLFCGKFFIINEDNIYSIVMPDYFGEIERRYYYTICPNCGNYNLIDEKLIPEQMKKNIEQRMMDNHTLHQGNLKIADQIYFGFVSNSSNRPLIRARVIDMQR